MLQLIGITSAAIITIFTFIIITVIRYINKRKWNQLPPYEKVSFLFWLQQHKANALVR